VICFLSCIYFSRNTNTAGRPLINYIDQHLTYFINTNPGCKLTG
jgi:hypothetical protein